MARAEFARKLQLTAAALGCTTRKALCARFRAANPATICGVDRLHKWMQGRAMPRGQQLFEDWRLVIVRGTGISLEDLWLREERQQRKVDALARCWWRSARSTERSSATRMRGRRGTVGC